MVKDYLRYLHINLLLKSEKIKIMQTTTPSQTRVIRSDKYNLVIKVKTEGISAHGWAILERGFANISALRAGMKELLSDKNTIEG